VSINSERRSRKSNTPCVLNAVSEFRPFEDSKVALPPESDLRNVKPVAVFPVDPELVGSIEPDKSETKEV